MTDQQGFTLIEILVALTVFAILASITSSSLYYAFNTRTRVAHQADTLNAIQLAFSVIQQDTLHSVQRPIRGRDMNLLPSFVGQSHSIEWTKDAYPNPHSVEKRSTLQRIALLCINGTLVRRTWNRLDSVKRAEYNESILLDHLTQCHFNYLNQNGQLLEEWHEQKANSNQQRTLLPQALQINLILKEWGEMNLLFIIPEGLYASS